MLGMPKTEHAIEQGNVSLEKAFGHTKKGKQSKMNSVDSANEVEDANLSGAFGSRGSFCGSSRCVVGVGLVLLSVLAVVFTVEEMSSTSYSAKRLMGPATQHPRRGRGTGEGAGRDCFAEQLEDFPKTGTSPGLYVFAILMLCADSVVPELSFNRLRWSQASARRWREKPASTRMPNRASLAVASEPGTAGLTV